MSHENDQRGSDRILIVTRYGPYDLVPIPPENGNPGENPVAAAVSIILTAQPTASA